MKTIIYIEDNTANYELVERILRATGRYTVMGATDGKEGIELVLKVKPSLVLVDLDLPAVNGFEITRRLKNSEDPEISCIPIVAVSANVLKNESTAALEAGCSAFVSKPFELKRFRAQIDSLVGTTEG